MKDQYALTYPDLSSSAPLGHVTNIYGFITTSVRLITTTPGKMVDQLCTNFILQVMMRLELNRTNYLMKKSTVTRNSI